MDGLLGEVHSYLTLSKDALFLFNMIYHDSLMASLKSIADRAGIDPYGQRRDILTNLIQKVGNVFGIVT